MKVGDRVQRSKRFYDRWGVTFIQEEIGIVVSVREPSAAHDGWITVTWGKVTTERLPFGDLEAVEEGDHGE